MGACVSKKAPKKDDAESLKQMNPTCKPQII